MEKINLPEAWLAHDRQLRPYVWTHRLLAFLSTLVSLSQFGFLVLAGAAFAWANYLGQTFSGLAWWLLYFAGLGLFAKLTTLPISAAHHFVERGFGLSKQSFGSWVADLLKGLAIGVVIGGIALSFLYLCVAKFGALWWVGSATFLILFSIVLAQLAPVILLPLFYKLKPMDPGPLKDRLLALCQKYSVQVKDVYHLGLGEKTEKGNAAFLGIGKTKRIVIGDTLYEKFEPQQVEAVFAHELGHQVHHDLWRGIALGAATIFVGFGVANWINVTWILPYFQLSMASPSGLLLFFIILGLVQMPMGVGQAMMSRLMERAADRFAAEKTQLSADLADALERLTYQNWGQFKPNPVWEFFTFSHPAPWRRITKLRKG